MIGLENFWRRLPGKEFRTFVHAPDRMRAVLEAAGLVRANRCEALVWTLDLYHRQGGQLSDLTRSARCSKQPDKRIAKLSVPLAPVVSLFAMAICVQPGQQAANAAVRQSNTGICSAVAFRVRTCSPSFPGHTVLI